MTPTKPIGEILGPDAMFFRVSCGEAKNPSTGVTYELNTSVGGAPIVRSGRSGKWFVLHWDDILKLACNAGIDETRQEEAA